MPIFEKITLTFRGQEYTVPEGRVMPMLAAVEDVMTMGQMARAITSGDIPLLKVSQAYAVALQHAGARVPAEEVYDEMFADDGTLRQKAIEALGVLQVMMIPPARLRKKSEPAPGKAGATTTAPTESSPSSTSSSSAAGG